MGLGGLIAGLSSLGAAGVIVLGIVQAIAASTSGQTVGEPPVMLSSVAGFSAMVLVIGAVPVAVGLALFVAGRGLYRSAPRPPGA